MNLKTILELSFVLLTMGAVACNDGAEEPESEPTAGDEIKAGAEEAGEDIEEAADDTAEEVDEAADDAAD